MVVNQETDVGLTTSRHHVVRRWDVSHSTPGWATLSSMYNWAALSKDKPASLTGTCTVNTVDHFGITSGRDSAHAQDQKGLEIHAIQQQLNQPIRTESDTLIRSDNFLRDRLRKMLLRLVVRSKRHLANTSQFVAYAICSPSTTTLLPSYYTVCPYYYIALLYDRVTNKYH